MPIGITLSPVHPRVCGEQDRLVKRFAAQPGSSPRVRGTGPGSGRHGHGTRFIPACAGNRSEAPARVCHRSVHPRVCGEQSSRRWMMRWPDGSSPRVRGTERYRARRQGSVRFIPACAGNSPSSTPPWPPETVHPRVCGEQRPTCASLALVAGSSPRVRGTGIGTARAQ